MVWIIIYIYTTNQISESDTSSFTLDSIYYRYEITPDTFLNELLFTPVVIDTAQKETQNLRISGAKDFSFDVNQGFDQGLKVNIAGEIEDVRIEGNLSDKATPSSTIRISDLDMINLKIFTQNFSGAIGNLTLNLPFGLQDEIQGGRIGLHDKENENIINGSYAINRGVFKRLQFAGEEGKQSPYFLEDNVIAGSEKVYLASGIGRPKLLKRDEDYNIDYERGIISFTNKNIITNQTRIEVEYQQAIEDYQNIYQETDGQFKIGDLTLYGLYRSKYDEKEEPLNFTLGTTEIESLKTAGDSLTVLHTYADTSSHGNYNFEDGQYVYVGEGNGHYIVTFFYVGDHKGDYIYDPIIKGFSYQGPGMGNYSPTKFIPLPGQNEFFAIGVNAFETIKISAYGSNLDKNTFSTIDDQDNHGKGGQMFLTKTLGIFSLTSEYTFYDDNLFMPKGKEDIDYGYQWNTDEPMKELGTVAFGVKPTDFFKLDFGYGVLNHVHKRKFLNLQPFFFQLGYEGVDNANKYFAGLAKKYGKFSFLSRYEHYKRSHLFNYDVKYLINEDVGIGIAGSYDKDTTGRGITTVLDVLSSPLSLSLGHRLYNDTTFLFGNVAINLVYEGLSFIGNLQQTQRYSQMRDETFSKVDGGEGNYVYDSITNTYIEKDGGDYIKKVFLLNEFERVFTRSFNIESEYEKSFFDLRGKFNYTDEEDFLSHLEDLILTVSNNIYIIEFNMRQDITEDARYALTTIASRERLVSLTPSYQALSSRLEIKEKIELTGELEIERHSSYSGELGYSISLTPLVRPKIGYSYSKIFSQYFEDLGLRLQTPRLNVLFGVPIKNNKGRFEAFGELIYRIYSIEEIPYFFAAAEPPGLTKVFESSAHLSIGDNTIFSLIYRTEFPPHEALRQNLKLQTRIRF